MGEVNTQKNLICVYAICKNESKFVDRWMESMLEADLIVVMDTGSDDDTFAVLQKWADGHDNVKVFQKVITPWRFDDARNACLDAVPPEYNIMLSTDLDEVMTTKGWAQILRDNWIEGKHIRGYYKFTWSHLPDGSEGRTFRYDKIHSRKDWCWKYPVHEMLWNVAGEEKNAVPYDRACDLFDQIHLEHFPDKTKSRSSYLPLLEKRAEEDPHDYYGLIYLAHEYHYKGFYQKSIDLLNRIIKEFPDRYTTVELASCYLFMGDSYRALNELDSAYDSYLKSIQAEPSYREPRLALGRLLIDKKDYTIAYVVLIDCMRKSYRHYTWLERDISWSYEPYDLLCLAAYYSGHKRDSLAYAAIAYQMNPTDERLKTNISKIIESTKISELFEF